MKNIYLKYFLIIIFLGAISLPGLKMLFKEESEGSISPVKASLDTLTSIKYFPQSFNSSFSNSFEGRKPLIQGYYIFRVFGLQESILDEKVFVGRNDWLFYGPNNDGYGIDDLMGRISLSKEEINKYLKNAEEQAEWLQKRGIKFLIVFCPNKQTVYPEFLPPMIRPGKNTVLDQVTDAFRKNGKIPFLDLRSVFKEKKKNTNLYLYFKTDTHWNELGAYYAWEAIRKALEEGRQLLNDSIEIQDKPSAGREIAEMNGIESQYEDRVLLIRVKTNEDSVKSKRAVFFHDSFYSYFDQYANSYFDTIYNRSHFWNSFDYKLIEEVKPDVVVYQIVERYTGALLRENPKEIHKP